VEQRSQQRADAEGTHDGEVERQYLCVCVSVCVCVCVCVRV